MVEGERRGGVPSLPVAALRAASAVTMTSLSILLDWKLGVGNRKQGLLYVLWCRAKSGVLLNNRNIELRALLSSFI